MLNDRIENHRYEKNIKLFKWCAGLALLLAVFRIAITPDVLTGGAKSFDFLTTLIPIGLYLQYRKTAKNFGGQFIEWSENEISFKSRKYKHTIIKLSNIESINIRLETIEINTPEKNYAISIEDYTKYEDRMRLKENFEKVNDQLKTIQTESDASR